MDFPITLTIAEFRPSEFTLRGIQRELVSEMIGHVTSGIMEANIDVDPVVASGPGLKFDGNSWHSWGSGEQTFSPVSVRVNNVLLRAAPTANRRQLLQNKNGVIAVTDDVYRTRPTVILQEGLVSVDWSMGKEFLCFLSGNRQSSFYVFHSNPGMEITLLLVNNGTNQLVNTFDPLIHWPVGAAPVIPAAAAGTSAMTNIKLVNVAGIIYGDFVHYTASAPWSYDASQPLFLS